jgi:phenylpropionate dioxygenase-like ring-hydroxylating dioxygenase large terminal subunit
MNKTDQIKSHYETILNESLKNTDLFSTNPEKSAHARESFNEEILKQYQPQSRNEVIKLLNDFAHPHLDEKAKELLTRVTNLATEKTLELPDLPDHNNITAEQTVKIINDAIDEIGKRLEKEHQNYVAHHLEAADIQRGEAAFRELLNVDVPKGILANVKNKITEKLIHNPLKLVCCSHVQTRSAVRTNKGNKGPVR